MTAILQLLCNKTLGPDGFPAKLYKLEPQLFAQALTPLFNNLPIGDDIHLFNFGHIMLIPKKGLVINSLDNIRPLLLLNTNYKICSTIIANCLRTTVNHLVHTDQIGYSPKLRGKAPLQDATSLLLINGTFSTPININSSVRQGDQVAGYLFILAIEPLLQHFRTSAHITPVTLATFYKIVFAYCDDVTIITTNQHALPYILDILNTFASVAALYINHSKSIVLGYPLQTHPFPLPSFPSNGLDSGWTTLALPTHSSLTSINSPYPTKTQQA